MGRQNGSTAHHVSLQAGAIAGQTGKNLQASKLLRIGQPPVTPSAPRVDHRVDALTRIGITPLMNPREVPMTLLYEDGTTASGLTPERWPTELLEPVFREMKNRYPQTNVDDHYI